MDVKAQLSLSMVSFRLLKPQHEPIGFPTMLEYGFGARVLGVPQHLPFFGQNKPRVGHFFDLHGFVDAMQTFAIPYTPPGLSAAKIALFIAARLSFFSTRSW